MRISIFILTLVACFTADAAEVERIRDGQVLLVGTEDTYKVGEKVYAIDDEGKRRAILYILKVEGDRAVAEIKKGRVKPGFSITPAGTLEFPDLDGNPDEDQKKANRLLSGFGVLGGAMLDRQEMRLAPATVIATGTGFSVMGFTDLRFSERNTGRLLFGYETFDAVGITSGAFCNRNSSNRCATEVGYFSFDALYNLRLVGDFWMGLGLGYRIPLSKSSTALQESSITSAVAGLLAAGYELEIGSTRFPLQVDYAMLIGPADTSTSVIGLRFGFRISP